MAFGKNIGLQGLRYRGGGPMLAWLFHRISGLGIVLFVGMHVVVSYMSHALGNEGATAINVFYESMPFQMFVYFCVLFHAVNGLRVICLDLWPRLLKYEREAIWLEWLVFLPVYGMSVFMMIQRMLAAK